MKRLVVIVSLVLLCLSAGNMEAARYVRYYPCYHYHPYYHYYVPHYYVPRPMVVYGVYHRAYVPGYWGWSSHYHRRFWVRGYWR